VRQRGRETEVEPSAEDLGPVPAPAGLDFLNLNEEQVRRAADEWLFVREAQVAASPEARCAPPSLRDPTVVRRWWLGVWNAGWFCCDRGEARRAEAATYLEAAATWFHDQSCVEWIDLPAGRRRPPRQVLRSPIPADLTVERSLEKLLALLQKEGGRHLIRCAWCGMVFRARNLPTGTVKEAPRFCQRKSCCASYNRKQRPRRDVERRELRGLRRSFEAAEGGLPKPAQRRANK
jgi:uncharacterized C2H2 Zn-finger protein